MRTVCLVWLLAWLSGGQAVAQTQIGKLLPLPLPTIDAEQSQRWVVKFAPLSLFDPSNTIQFGIERFVGQHQSIQAEFGYGWQGMNLWRSTQDSRYSDIELWRGRAEWRYYRHGGPIGSYIALEGLYKRINARENGTIGLGCDMGPCQYFQLYSAPISKQVWAGHVKFGRQFRLLPNTNRLLADFYGGVGVRGSTLEQIPIPQTGVFYYNPRGLFNLFSTTTFAAISISYGIKIGFSF